MISKSISRKKGVGSLIAGLFIILILIAFIASLIVINRSQGRYSDLILKNIERRMEELNTNIQIYRVEVLTGNILNLTIKNQGSTDVLINYIGIFNKTSNIGHYYNASYLGSTAKGVFINRFSQETNITTYENILENLSSGGMWIIQIITSNGIIVSTEYPTTTTPSGSNISRWETSKSSPVVIPVGSSATYGHLAKLTQYNASSIITIDGTHVSGDLVSISADDNNYYVVEANQFNSTLYLWPSQTIIGGKKYFELGTIKPPYTNAIHFSVDKLKDDNKGDKQYNWKILKSNKIGGKKYDAKFVYQVIGGALNAGIYQFYYNVDIENKDNKILPKETLAFSVNIYVIDNSGTIVNTLATHTALANIPIDLAPKGQPGDKYNGTLVGTYTLTYPVTTPPTYYLLVEYWVGLNRTSNTQSNNVKVRIRPFINDGTFNYTDYMKIRTPGSTDITFIVSFPNTNTYGYLVSKMNFTTQSPGFVNTTISMLNWTRSTYDNIYSNYTSTPKNEFKWIIQLRNRSEYYSGTSLKIKVHYRFYGYGSARVYLGLLQAANKYGYHHGIYLIRVGYRDIYFYDLDNSSWISIGMAPFNWPNYSRITYLNSTKQLFVTNSTHLMIYDPISHGFTPLVNLTSMGIPSRYGSNLLYLDKFEDLVIYIPGGGSNQIWIYNLTSKTFISSPLNLPISVDKYSVAQVIGGDTIYLLPGYSNDQFIRINITSYLIGSPFIDNLSRTPSTYVVGITYNGTHIFIVDKGGAIYEYKLSTNNWSMVGPELPITPYYEGDRLFYYSGNLIYIRMDSTRDVFYIPTSQLYKI